MISHKQDTVEKPSEWALFPWVIVRFASIARSRLARTRLNETVRSVERVCGLRRALVSSSELLSSRMHAVIPKLDATGRREGLEARRRIFQLEIPADGAWIDCIGEIEPALKADLTAWIARRRELAAAEAARDAVYEREVRESDRELWILLNDPAFRRGLLTANPLLSAHLGTLEGRPPEQLSARERAWRMRAVRYLDRAALKPTPFGFFAGVALAQLGGDPFGGALDLSRLVSVDPCLQPEPVHCDSEEDTLIKKATTVYLDPGAFKDANEVWAISRETGEPTRVNDAGNVFGHLVQSSKPSVGWDEICDLAGDEVLDRLVSAGVIGINDRDTEKKARHRGPLGHSPPKKTRYEDVVHSTVLPLPANLFSGFANEILCYGARAIFPGLLPEQQGLARLFIELYGERRDVPALVFFRDFLAVRRERGLDQLGIQAAAARFSDPSDVRLKTAAAPIADALRGAFLSRGKEAESTLSLDLSPFAGWEQVGSTRLSLLLGLGPGGIASSRFWIRLWGAERMSLLPRYASALTSVATGLIRSFRGFMRLWPETADLGESSEVTVDSRPVVTDRTIDVPGCPPSENGIALRDLHVRLDRSTGSLSLAESRDPSRWVKPVFLGVSTVPLRSPLCQFLEMLDGHRVSLFELVLRTLGGMLAEDAVWTRVGPIERVPSIVLGQHIVLSPQIARIEARALPVVTSNSRRQAFVDFHSWREEHGLPMVALVHASRGALWVDLGSPDGVRSFHGHVRGAERIHMIYPFTTDDDALRSVRGESHEVEFALELAVGRSLKDQDCVKDDVG